MPKVLSALSLMPVRLALLLGLCLLPISSAEAGDNSAFECGRNLYKSKMYKDALPYLKSSQALYSYDNRAFYYEALCYHRMGQINAAMSAYQNVIAKFPDSDAAELSKKAIASIRGVSPNSSNSSSTLPGGSLTKLKSISVDQLPAELVLSAPDQEGKPVVEALVSGVKVKFLVDTTVANSVIGSDVAKQSKLPEAAVKSKDDYYLHDIKLGTMTRAAFPIQISSKQPTLAVLGADYFEFSSVSYEAPKATLAPTKEPAKEPTKDPTKEPTKDPAKEPAQDPTKEPAKEPAAEAAKEAVRIGTLTIKRMVGYKNPFDAGLKFFNAGQFKQAYPLLKISAVNRPRDPRALYVLAVCSHRLNKIDEARSGYRNVLQRFPGSEASQLSAAALMAIDPSYAASVRAKSDQYTLLGPTPKEHKRQEFEIPYIAENGYFKVTALIDGHNVEMYMNSSLSNSVFSTAQINQIDSTYLDNASDISSKPLDPNNSNNLSETVTRNIRLKRVKLGKIEATNVPAQIVDTATRFGYVSGSYDKPLLGNSVISGWRWEILINRRMLRFTQMQ
ncbi:tetratricopeptide repeat protein [bacterium]|nr:tetratricopeptide repeat protein [bacterium]